MRAPCGCPGRTIRAGGFHLGRPDKLGRRGGPGCVGCREGSACHPGDNPRGSIVQVEPGAGGWPGLIPAPVLQDSQRLSRVWRYPPGLIACYVRAACPSTPQPPAPKLEIQRSLLHSKPEARPNFRNHSAFYLCLPASWPLHCSGYAVDGHPSPGLILQGRVVAGPALIPSRLPVRPWPGCFRRELPRSFGPTNAGPRREEISSNPQLPCA